MSELSDFFLSPDEVQALVEKSQANGYASLDSNAKVPTAELPDSVLGAVAYQGAWNASTNTPALASGVGTSGFYYVVSVAGSTNIDGITDWEVSDWAIFNGTVWEKIDNTDLVTSVAGKIGDVLLDKTDVGLDNITNIDNTNASNITAGTLADVRIAATITRDSELSAGLLTKSDTTHDHDADYEPIDSNIQLHITNTTNPHSVDKADVGLANVINANTTIATNITSGFLDDARIPAGITRDTELTAGLLTKSDTTHDHDADYEPIDSTILKESDVDNVPIDGVLTAPISSNWAYDHGNAATDPHTQYQKESQRSQANGYASLDGNAKVPTAELPDSVLGSVIYKGAWNATTNTPALASGVGSQGDYYVVSVAGSTNLDGITGWSIGDWVIFNGTVWEKVDNTDAVLSVGGKTGHVTLSAVDVGLSNVPNVNATNASNISSGTLADARVASTITRDTELTAGLATKSDTTHNHDADYSDIAHNHSTLYEPKNTNIQTHIGTTGTNPHGVTKTNVGLSNVANSDTTNATNIINGELADARIPSTITRDTELTAGLLTKSDTSHSHYTIVKGSSTFVGSGSERTIAHGVGSTPTTVTATATSDPGGYLGEIWVRKDATNIYVGNSGSHTGAFDWTAIA